MPLPRAPCPHAQSMWCLAHSWPMLADACWIMHSEPIGCGCKHTLAGLLKFCMLDFHSANHHVLVLAGDFLGDRSMFRSDFLCASDATRHAAWQHTSFAHVFAVFQAPGVGSARGYLIPQRRFGRVLVCDPRAPTQMRLHPAMCMLGAHYACLCLQVGALCSELGVGSDGLQLADVEGARGCANEFE